MSNEFVSQNMQTIFMKRNCSCDLLFVTSLDLAFDSINQDDLKSVYIYLYCKTIQTSLNLSKGFPDQLSLDERNI